MCVCVCARACVCACVCMHVVVCVVLHCGVWCVVRVCVCDSVCVCGGGGEEIDGLMNKGHWPTPWGEQSSHIQ